MPPNQPSILSFIIACRSLAPADILPSAFLFSILIKLVNSPRAPFKFVTIFVIDSSGIFFAFNNLIKSSDAVGLIGLLKSPSNKTSFNFL